MTPRDTHGCNGHAWDRIARQKQRPNRQKCPKNAQNCVRGQFGTSPLKVARLQSEFFTKGFYWATISLPKNAPKFSPKFLNLSFVGPKNPSNVPPNFPISLRKLKKSPTSFCRSAGRIFSKCFQTCFSHVVMALFSGLSNDLPVPTPGNVLVSVSFSANLWRTSGDVVVSSVAAVLLIGPPIVELLSGLLRAAAVIGQPWWTFRIFFILSAWGKGRESPRRQEGGGGGEGEALRGLEGVCEEFGGGGGGGIFFVFRGRNSHEATDEMCTSATLGLTLSDPVATTTTTKRTSSTTATTSSTTTPLPLAKRRPSRPLSFTKPLFTGYQR